ncbi:hypothetical protein Agub_g9537 [Astrephomene gubernaculifera]|uniref:Calmodulin n=1 Tax=Astrephomene gubernaculifera TaxID=47775 RepID=A0AAD3DTH2_9CHLO|nr:hypothetical protein Agub_g9537 [Astrephomene gubernaculifera]
MLGLSRCMAGITLLSFKAGSMMLPSDGESPGGTPRTDGSRIVAITLSPESQLPSMKRSTSKARAELEKFFVEFDKNNDGTIDLDELANVMEKLTTERSKSRTLKWIIIAMSIFFAMLVGALSGMSWGVVAALKDTKVGNSGVMYLKDSDSVIVQTANSDMLVANGILVNRHAFDQGQATVNGAIGASAGSSAVASSVLRTASYLGDPHRFTSEVSVRALMELRYLYIQGPDSVEVALAVQGVARVPMANSTYGTVVQIVTVAGTITLDGEVIAFSEAMANIFSEAGFVVSASRRSLLGFYDILGFFNFIADMTVFDLPVKEPKPQLPAGNFLMSIKVYEPCVLLLNTSRDRCVYFLPEQYRPGAVPPPMPSDPPMPPPSPMLPNLPPNPSPPPMSPLSSPPSGNETAAPPPPSGATRRTSRRLQQEFLHLTPHRSLLTDEADGYYDLAGTEVINGARYMVHYETSIMWNGLVRTMYEFAAFPDFRKIDVMDNTTKTVNVWQEQVDANGTVIANYYCNQNPLPPTAFDSLSRSNKSLANFTFIGYEDVNDAAARHFRLDINQGNSTLSVDYWDSRRDYTPLGFEFVHSDIGHVMIYVTKFQHLTDADIEQEQFIWPASVANATCTNDTSVPRVTSAFTVPLYGSRTEARRRRRLLTSGYTADAWFDDAEGVAGVHNRQVAAASTAVAPRHVGLGAELEVSNGTSSRRAAVEVAISEMCGGTTYEAITWLAQLEKEIKCGVAAAKYGPSHQYLYMALGCDDVPIPYFPFLKLGGFIAIETCPTNIVAKGCLKLTLSLSPLNLGWLGKALEQGLNIASISICAGYNFNEKIGFVFGSLEVHLILFKLEVYGQVEFSKCCTKFASAGVEAWFGIDLFFWSWYAQIGDFKIPGLPHYFTGSESEDQQETDALKYFPGHMGCLHDWVNSQRALTDMMSFDNPSMTLERCSMMAAMKGYSYYAVEDGDECYGGNDLKYALRFGLYDESKCQRRCGGNGYQVCGGVSAMTMYYNFDTGNYVGCFKDWYDRTLPVNLASWDGSMTNQKCKGLAMAKGYPLYATQTGNDCWGATDIYTALMRYGPGDGCTDACKGNGAETCGGSWRNSVWLNLDSSGRIGCFGDGPDRAMEVSLGEDWGAMTPQLCEQWAKHSGMKYYAVEAGGQCFGSTKNLASILKYGKYGKPNGYGSYSWSCDNLCTGDKSQYCGGGWALQTYVVNHNDGFLGCFIDNPNRALPYLLESSGSMTVERCKLLAASKGFRYYGLQCHKECFAGNDLVAATAYGQAAGTDCRDRCDGNKNQICGGGWRNSLYIVLENA